MRSGILFCSRLINRSLIPSKSRNISIERCLCNAVSDRGQSGNSSEQGAEQLQNLLDEAAQGLGPLDKETAEDEWHTSPYPEGAIINPRQSQSAKSLRPGTDPGNTSIILFPGYGSQYIGMGRELVKFPKARDIFDASSAILKLDVLKMMLNGPKHTLNELKYADPLVFISSLAALEKLKEERPWAIENCVATAGFSVGEITALTFAGVFSFSEGLKFVRARAEAIECASDLERGGMAIVHYNASSKLKLAISKAKDWCLDRGINDPECIVATYLNPNMKVIAGHDEALKFLECNKSVYKLEAFHRVPARGAYHTKLMLPVAERLRKKLKDFELMEPVIAVHSNVDGGYFRDARHISRSLPKQVYMPIKWEQMLHILYEREPTCPFPETIICGPNNHLGEYLRHVNAKAACNIYPALSFIQENLKEFKLCRVFPVSIPGAVHTKLMKPASAVLRQLLNKMDLLEPSAHTYSNVTGKRYRNLENVRKYLPEQICKPMLWEQLLHKLFDRDSSVNMPSVFTCGPRSPALKNSICRVNTGASKKCIFVF